MVVMSPQWGHQTLCKIRSWKCEGIASQSICAAGVNDGCIRWRPSELCGPSWLPIIPEPHTIICDELFVHAFFLHFLNRCYGNLDKTPSLIASNEQAIEGEIRTRIELEKTPRRYFSVHVFYRCFEREGKIGCQIGMILS